jgi:hypothetical protein
VRVKGACRVVGPQHPPLVREWRPWLGNSSLTNQAFVSWQDQV